MERLCSMKVRRAWEHNRFTQTAAHMQIARIKRG